MGYNGDSGQERCCRTLVRQQRSWPLEQSTGPLGPVDALDKATLVNSAAAQERAVFPRSSRPDKYCTLTGNEREVTTSAVDFHSTENAPVTFLELQGSMGGGEHLLTDGSPARLLFDYAIRRLKPLAPCLAEHVKSLG
ncbi:hypothetical protein EVAR_44297_1 [Eumeta japonica]|uniref:Uncharacterized protein n=1 Tax=Eumeta variegata TaxID=151549 RepID=A0A4C1WP87_EUMVA|nr:hypothetical protein EVAR_44297_1 [Eumeta japonica]